VWNTVLKSEKDQYANMFRNSGGHNKPTKKLLPMDLFLPTMRKLGLVDCLDPKWNYYGSWNDILIRFARRGRVVVPKTKADAILQEKSHQWRSARNSQTCRGLMPSEFNITPAPQCFRYFPKCSVVGCCTVETAGKPHKIRCTRCWYYHACSPACDNYSELFDMHQCDFTPLDEAKTIQQET
jgi:hypothetical protein